MPYSQISNFIYDVILYLLEMLKLVKSSCNYCGVILYFFFFFTCINYYVEVLLVVLTFARNSLKHSNFFLLLLEKEKEKLLLSVMVCSSIWIMRYWRICGFVMFDTLLAKLLF